MTVMFLAYFSKPEAIPEKAYFWKSLTAGIEKYTIGQKYRSREFSFRPYDEPLARQIMQALDAWVSLKDVGVAPNIQICL